MQKEIYKAAFLDRDGVINEDLNYIYEKNKFILKDGILKLLNLLSKKKYLIFIITNQSGIARGFFSEKEYQSLTKYYLSIFKNLGINIEAVYHCPHHPEYSEPPFDKCNCRKPKNGLFIKAQTNYNIDMGNSIAIGDSLRDLEAAYLSGVKKRILLSEKDYLSSEFITHRFTSISECSEFILGI